VFFVTGCRCGCRILDPLMRVRRAASRSAWRCVSALRPIVARRRANEDRTDLASPARPGCSPPDTRSRDRPRRAPLLRFSFPTVHFGRVARSCAMLEDIAIELVPLRHCPADGDHGLTFVACRRRQTALAVFRPASASVLNVDRINRIDPAFAYPALAPAAGHAPPLPHKAAFRYPRDRVSTARSGRLLISGASTRPDSTHGVHYPSQF